MTELELEEIALVLADSLDELRKELADTKARMQDLAATWAKEVQAARAEIEHLKRGPMPPGKSMALPLPKTTL